MSQPILEMRSITKEFPGVKALSDVSLTVKTGETIVLTRKTPRPYMRRLPSGCANGASNSASR